MFSLFLTSFVYGIAIHEWFFNVIHMLIKFIYLCLKRYFLVDLYVNFTPIFHLTLICTFGYL